MRLFSERMLRLLRIRPPGVAQMQVGVRKLSPNKQKLRRPMNGYNFTERVRKTLALAREASITLGHEYVGTEHILLGILEEGEGVGTTVLLNLGVAVDQLRDSVLDIVKRGRAANQRDLPYTSRAKKVLEFAMFEARELNHAYVGTEHLLLGLMREEKGIAAQVLTEAGVTLDAARAETLRVLGTDAAVPRSKMKGAWASATTSMGSGGIPYQERLRRVLSAAYDVAARQRSAEVTSAHAAIALLEHGEGLANAALDALRFDRASALASLNSLESSTATSIEPDDALRQSTEFIAVLNGMYVRPTRTTSIGTQDLLLSLLKTSPDVAEVFSKQNVGFENARAAVSRLSG